ncbi:MAG: permease-like cell division protein FtsX [Acidimicrobiia bacterium]
MPDHDRTAERAASVMGEFADQIDVSDDAWAKVRGRIDDARPARSRRFWVGLGLAGAAAAALLVVVLAVVNRDDEPTIADSQDTVTDVEPGFVALTVDGELRRFSPEGYDEGLILDTEWGFVEGDDYPAPPTFSVTPDGTVYVSRPTQPPDCDTQSLDGEILAVPLEGGEPEVVVTHASSPTVSPDGNSLAYLALDGGLPCEEPAAAGEPVDVNLEILDLTTLGSDSPRVTDLGTVLANGSPAWSPDGTSLALTETCLECPEGQMSGVTIHPVDGGTPHRAVVATDISAGPDVAFADPTSLYVERPSENCPNPILDVLPPDTDESSSADAALPSETLPCVRIARVPTDVTTPTELSDAPVVFDVSLIDQVQSLSTLVGPDAPGLLAVVEGIGSVDGTGHALVFVEGESAPGVLTTDVVAAAWIPGTRSGDLPDVSEIRVFMSVEAGAEQIDEVRSSLENDPDVAEFTFVDKEDAFEEFRRTFEDDPSISENISADDLPVEFRIVPVSADSEAELVERYGALPGVDTTQVSRWSRPPADEVAE